MLLIRGHCYPIRRLHKRFYIENSKTSIHEGIIVMVENEKESLCISADELVGQHQVVVKTLPIYIKKVAVIEPVKEASVVLQEMAKGNLKICVKEDYKGDHAEIKDALNFTISTITGYINEVSNILGEISNGNLSVGISRDYLSDFIEMKDSINQIVISLNEAMENINSSASQVSRRFKSGINVSTSSFPGFYRTS